MGKKTFVLADCCARKNARCFECTTGIRKFTWVVWTLNFVDMQGKAIAKIHKANHLGITKMSLEKHLKNFGCNGAYWNSYNPRFQIYFGVLCCHYAFILKKVYGLLPLNLQTATKLLVIHVLQYSDFVASLKLIWQLLGFAGSIQDKGFPSKY